MPEVLIAGGGPTGLMLALELAGRGVSCRVVERLTSRSRAAKATSIHSRTLEIMEQWGIAGRFLEAGVPMRCVAVYLQDRREASRLDLSRIQSRYPYILGLGQFETERFLEERLAELGVPLERGVELTGFEPEDQAVLVRLRHLDGRAEELRVAWLAGCDGAHSLVRHGLGMEFSGQAYPELYVTGECALEWDMPSDEFIIIQSPAGSFTVAPLAGGRYIFFGELAEPLGPQEAPTLAQAQTLADRRGPGGMRLSDPSWLTYFHIHQRQAARYSQGRVFLLGDAAHVQTPIGGKGMNTGIQDAYNLGWKLALVVQGKARPELLESYHQERHPVGREMLEYSDRLHHSQIDAHYQPGRTEAVKRKLLAPLASDELRHRVAQAVGEISVHYRGGPLTGGGGADGPQPGDLVRHPARAGGPHLLLGRGPDLTGFAERVETDGELRLVRPDGYLEYRGDEAGLHDYLGRYYRL